MDSTTLMPYVASPSIDLLQSDNNVGTMLEVKELTWLRQKVYMGGGAVDFGRLALRPHGLHEDSLLLPPQHLLDRFYSGDSCSWYDTLLMRGSPSSF